MLYIVDAMLNGHMSYGQGGDIDMPHVVQRTLPQVPLLTYGHMVLGTLSFGVFF